MACVPCDTAEDTRLHTQPDQSHHASNTERLASTLAREHERKSKRTKGRQRAQHKRTACFTNTVLVTKKNDHSNEWILNPSYIGLDLHFFPFQV